MRLAILLAAIASLGFSSAVPVASASALDDRQVRTVMLRAETLLRESGIDVAGYAEGALPQVMVVPSTHVFLQGNDGAWIAGRIYLNEDAAEACQDLTLLHEIVHDATVRHRLFRSVSNSEIRDMIEALADEITHAAAQSPWRPRCLPTREFSVPTAELASLALR
jgi:hypothetical protein